MRKRPFIVLGIIVVVLVGIVVYKILPFSPIVVQILFNKEIALKNTNNSVNILLLGIGGGKHEGPNLTDSIIVANINPKSNKIVLTSIPRDLWIPDLKQKINYAYASGEEQRKGGGLLLAKAVVKKVVGQDIDYAIRIDFAGFIKAVDLVGGLDIDVERSLDDYAYPVEGKEDDSCGHTSEEIEILATSSSEFDAFPCRYKYIHYDKGLLHMSGEQALEFVRSRHALGVEGTDFARSRRQEKVIKAFKDKVFSAGTLLNPLKVVGLYSTLRENIDTDIPQASFDDFIKLAQKMRASRVQTGVIDYGDSSDNRLGLLVNPPISAEYNLQWVLIPRSGNGNFSQVHEYVRCTLESSVSACQLPTKSAR